MPHYTLRIEETQDELRTTAPDRDIALVEFSAQLGIALTLTEQDHAPPYMMDEWYESPHWGNPYIPVFEIQSDDETPNTPGRQA